MNRFKIALLTSILIPALAIADDLSDVKDKILSQYPNNNKIVEVQHTPLPGIFEVDVGRNVAYTDKEGSYMIFGHLFNMADHTDLTQKRIDVLSKIDFNKLPLADAIKIVKGNGTNKFAVFSDPDCPFCKKLESSLEPLTDYTEYVFLYPIDGLHPGSSVKSQSIWCSKDMAKAWKDALVNSKEPDAKTCDNPIERDQKLGAGFGVQGTPTLVSLNGKVVPGAIDGQALDSFIKGK